MPDPVTNLQIEDVLSSIRKLVSENNRAEAGMSAAAKTAKRESETAATSTAGVAAGAQQAPDRLLLTPERLDTVADDLSAQLCRTLKVDAAPQLSAAPI